MQLASAPEIAEAITPEIQALARGLENDPKKIFDYVHDHIRYVHYFGSKKGAQLTLLERSGNDFDQCALLVAMLRAAGLSASYRFGTVFMPYEISTHRDFKHWLGLTKPNTNWTESKQFAFDICMARGFPCYYAVDEYQGQVFHHVWVVLNLNNQTNELDPAFKVSEPISGINLASAMRLDTNQLMTTAGGTTTNAAKYIQSLSEVNLRNKLRDYTTNLLSYLQSNYPNASVEEIMGGQYIVSSAGDSLSTSLSFVPFLVKDTAPIIEWNYIPTNLMTTLKITVDATSSQFLYMPQLQGQKLALTFSTNGLAQLWLEDDLLLQQQTSGGGTVDVALNIDHPYGYWDFAYNTLINTNWSDHSVTNTYQRTNASYAITYAFEPDQEWLRQRQDKLDQYRQQGLADTSREVLTETLNIMGLNWMLQTERIFRVLAAQQDMLLMYHHRFGRMAQEFGKGYYVDVYQQLNGNYPASGEGINDWDRTDRQFDLAGFFGSAAEHGLIEQLQSSNLVAASTVKMLQIGNTNGQRICLADSNNWADVSRFLTNYNATTNFLKSLVDNGDTLLLPANGSNVLDGAGSWAGYGALARGPNAGFFAMNMLISGKYHGGYVGTLNAVVDPPYVGQASCVQPNKFNQGSALVPPVFSGDPVSMVDGSFRVSAADLALGQPEPRGVRFTRYYSSSRRLHNLASMAHGWTHNYNMKAMDVSAPLAGLGDTTPAQMAPMIVATKSAFELYNTSPSPKNWAVTALIAKWGLDQLINNAVSVTLGDDTIQFIKQPNGTYTPPAKSTMTMYKTNGVYRVRERHGNTYKFNSVGLLTNIVDLYNQNLTVTYDSSNRVSTIKDWKNRTLTLTYSGSPQRLATVADNTGRSVSYDYTTAAGQTDLTSVTDPESKASTFVYDTNHQIIATLDALNRVVVSNSYDGFGRVIEQYSKGDANQVWQLFWSGYLNTELDPAGGRKQYYFDDKHRLVATLDPLGHSALTYYDGQDHVIEAVSHLPATNVFFYDGHHNLIATLDALGYTNQFFYDSKDNLIRSVDARGKTSTFGYNTYFLMTGSTNGAGDWATFVYSTTDGTLTSRTDPGG
ncbi:MAG: transglutaminase domain-containing protein, partial [Verrucomicrobiota bacterium]